MPTKKSTKAQAKPALAKKHRLSFRGQMILTSIFAALLLIIANSAIWVNQSIFNTNNFTNTAVSSLTSESSRQAMATEVVDRALADRPVAKQVAGPTATRLVSGLLGTDQFNKVLTTAVGKLQIYLTSQQRRENITVNLSGVKNVLNTLIGVADTAGADTNQASQRLQNVPDQITLLNGNNIPNFYSYGLVFLWLGPIAALLALGLLLFPYWRRRQDYVKISLIQGGVVVAAGLLSLLIGPLFRPPVLSSVNSSNMRVVIGNLYDAFISRFNHQSYVLILIGILLAFVPLAVSYGLTLARRRSTKKA